jgi:hypothetical protein
MPTYTVTLTRSITVDVTVDADSPEEAATKANQHSFPLPPRDEWTGVKDWRFEVYDDNGGLLHEEEA